MLYMVSQTCYVFRKLKERTGFFVPALQAHPSHFILVTFMRVIMSTYFKSLIISWFILPLVTLSRIFSGLSIFIILSSMVSFCCSF